MASVAGNPPIRTPPVTIAEVVADNTIVPPAFAIQITASVSGTVTLTLVGGSTIIVTPSVGDNIYPYAVIRAAAGTATVTRMYNLR